MRAMVVEVVPEIEQFIFEIYRRPEQRVIAASSSRLFSSNLCLSKTSNYLSGWELYFLS
jgi:hypothetical protein